MKKTAILRTVTGLVLLILILTPGCQSPTAPTTTSPPTTPAPAAALPPTPVSPAEFKVSALSVTPTEIVGGEEATVAADISNVGGTEGTFTAILKVNGVETEEREITLAGGEKDRVSFTIAEDVSGTYDIEISGQTGTLTVLKPAELEVSSLVVTPALVLPGQEAIVEADIANIGEVDGTLEAILKVNGVDTDSRILTLAADARDKTSFTVIRDLVGTYDISIGGQRTTLTVADVETYDNEFFNYTISYPSGWVLDDSDPNKVSMVKSGIANLGVSVDILPVGTSLDEHYAIVVDNTKSSYLDLRELSRTEVIEDGDAIAYDAMFSYTYEGAKFKMRVVVSMMGRYGYAVWASAREAVYELNRPLLEACMESFKPPVVAVNHYTNNTHGFSITLPRGWDGLETGELMPLLNIENPIGEPVIRSYVFVNRTYESTTTEDNALGIAVIWSEEPGYRIVSQREVTLGEATQGYEVIFTYQENGYDIKRKAVSVIRGTQVFTLLVYTLASTYDSSSSTIDQFTNSCTLEEPWPVGVSRQTSLLETGGEIVTLDPARGEGGPGGLIGAIFSGLVRIDRDLKVVPDIAERWEVSDDGTVYTFYLREDVKFHDGKSVTAHDFKYSWERACDPETDSPKALNFLGDIVGAKEMLDGKATELSGVRVIDEHTLEVTIDGPKPYFLGKMTYITAYVVDRANIARGMNWTDNPNGTGPFKMKEWKKDELLILERNDDYYLEPAKLDNIVFQIFAGRSMMMYEQGEIDTAGVSLADLERVLDPSDPLNQELLTTISLNINYLGFNVTMSPFDDSKVRRAFALALDMDKILEVSYKDNAERAGGFVPPGIPGHNEALEPLPFDPERARQLIAESEYGSVDNLPPIIFYSLYYLGSAEEAMIGMWQANLGVNIEVEIIEELEEWYELRRQREFQLFSSGWYADYIDPQNFLEILFHSQSGENTFDYSNPDVDAALEKAAVERDEETRLKMYQDIEKMILEDLPAAPFYQSWKSHLLVKPYVEGYYLAPIGINIWQDISIKPY